MRALLVTEQGIQEVTLDENQDNNLQTMYHLLHCRTIASAGCPDNHHACLVDDEGLLTMHDDKQVNKVSWHPEILVGRLLITGFDPATGETTPATMSAESLSQMLQIGRYSKQKA
jgi:hypothetical protein